MTNSIFTNLWSNPPGASKINDIWICPDARYYSYFIWNGTQWDAYIKGKLIELPTRNTEWTVYSGTLGLTKPYLTCGAGLIIDKKNYSTPAYVEACIAHWLPRSQYAPVLIFFRNSSDGKAHWLSLTSWSSEVGTPTLSSTKLNNLSSWNSDYRSEQCMSYFIGVSFIWFRLVDNGTNRYCQFSSDGFNWREFHSIGRTDFMTGNQFGFGGYGDLVHWKRY